MAAFINAIREARDFMAAVSYLQKYWDLYMEIRAQRVTIMNAVYAEARLTDKAQKLCRSYLQPDGKIKSKDELADKLIELFDGPEQREALDKRCAAYALKEPS